MEPGQELAQLRARVAHLESLVERMTGRRPAPRQEASALRSPGLDRRRVLRKGLGLSAAAVAGVGMLDAVGSSASAADGDGVLVAQTVSPTSASSSPTRILNASTENFSNVLFQVDNITDSSVPIPDGWQAAIVGTYAGTKGRVGYGAGVLGVSDSGAALRGEATSGEAVVANSSSGTAIVACSDSGTGIYVDAEGEAIDATSRSDVAITGRGPYGVAGVGTPGGGVSVTTGVAAFGDVGLQAHGTVVGVRVESGSGPAVEATSTSGAAIHATSGSERGMVVTSDSADGIHTTSRSDSGIGIVGWGGGFGVVGNGTGNVDSVGVGATGTTGVLASGAEVGVDSTSQTGTAVKATSTSGTGVHATSSSGAAIEAISASGHAVHATSGSTAAAVLGESTEGVGITGTSGAGVGVRATSTTGTALAATSTQAVGATFQGGAAAIRLIPTSAAGHPTTGRHQRGEIVLDHHGDLWVCTRLGTPGTWKQLAFA